MDFNFDCAVLAPRYTASVLSVPGNRVVSRNCVAESGTHLELKQVNFRCRVLANRW